MMLLLVFSAILILLVVLSLYKSNVYNLIKLMCISTLVAFFSFGYIHYKDVLGAPIEGLPDEFIYVHHTIGANDQIFLWAKIDDQHRLFVFAYDRDSAKELEKGKKSREEGIEMKGAVTTLSEEDETGTTEKSHLQLEVPEENLENRNLLKQGG